MEKEGGGGGECPFNSPRRGAVALRREKREAYSPGRKEAKGGVLE